MYEANKQSKFFFGPFEYIHESAATIAGFLTRVSCYSRVAGCGELGLTQQLPIVSLSPPNSDRGLDIAILQLTTCIGQRSRLGGELNNCDWATSAELRHRQTLDAAAKGQDPFNDYAVHPGPLQQRNQTVCWQKEAYLVAEMQQQRYSPGVCKNILEVPTGLHAPRSTVGDTLSECRPLYTAKQSSKQKS